MTLYRTLLARPSTSGGLSSMSQVNVWSGKNPYNHSFNGNSNLGSISFARSSLVSKERKESF